MTTAGRPTFDTARGGQSRGDLSAMSKQYSSRDLPSHKTLKYRQTGQGTIEETLTRDFRGELDERDRGTKRPKIAENDDDPKRKKLELYPVRDLDKDDPLDSDSSDDDEYNEEALLAELDKIKRERKIEKAKQEMEKQKEEEQIRMEQILNGNPLVTRHLVGVGKDDYTVKRRWNDDVVFKNCARSEPEKTTKEFINDTLRSQFHKKFMEKYIR